jgi:uncharacterized protein YeaO (DUF488 family)
MVRVRTKRWDEEVEPEDGLRVLITRYRPRGLKKADETWELWFKDLGPSEELLADFKGKGAAGRPIEWDEYKARYLEEMRSQRALIESLARNLNEGQAITLLCASTCVDPGRCHRNLLKQLVESAAKAMR